MTTPLCDADLHSISNLPMPSLLAIYNHWTTKPVKKFEARRVAVERVSKLIETLNIGMAEAMAPLGDSIEAAQAEAQEQPTQQNPADEGMQATQADDAERDALAEAGEPIPAALTGQYWVAGDGRTESGAMPSWQAAADWLAATIEGRVAASRLLAELAQAEGSAFMAADENDVFQILAAGADGVALPLDKQEFAMTKVAKKAAKKAGGEANRQKAETRKAAAPQKQPAPRTAKKAPNGELNLTGVRLTLFNLMLRKNGVSNKEACDATGWRACAGTIGTLMAAVGEHGYTARKEKVDGETRYKLAAPAKAA